MGFTAKQQRFIEEYTVDFNATQAALRAGYSERTAHSIGHENLNKPELAAAIQERIEQLQMRADEASIRMARIARFDPTKYIDGVGRAVWFDVERLKADGYGDMIKGLKYTPDGGPIWELVDSQRALEKIYANVTDQLGDESRPVQIQVRYVDSDD